MFEGSTLKLADRASDWSAPPCTDSWGAVLKSSFRKAAELWDSVAGPADWEAFASEFDRALGNLTGDELDRVGELLNQLNMRRATDRTTPIPDAGSESTKTRVGSPQGAPNTPVT